MSADNWAVCPRCERNRQAAIRDRENAVADAYGKVPVAEFDSMRADLDAQRAEQPPRTFREDYEFWGADEGFVTANYRGGCKECGLTLHFEHTEALDVDGAS